MKSLAAKVWPTRRRSADLTRNRHNAPVDFQTIALVTEICHLAGNRDLITDIRRELRRRGVLNAIENHDTPTLYDWMVRAIAFQGISDYVAHAYMEEHGSVTWDQVEQSLADQPRCGKLTNYWAFHHCGYNKTNLTCSKPRYLTTCPLPAPILRNGRLNQSAFSVYLFMRDVAARDFAGWLDTTISFARREAGNIDGARSMLIKVGDDFGIMYATNIPSPGFQRFSISHEIGHYCIEGHPEALLTSGVHQSFAGFVSADPFEQEADHFAAALLMPERPFRREIEKHDAGLGCIEALRRACETSLTATAIRYSTLTRDGVAVLLSHGKAVDCCFMSDGLKQAKGLSWIRKGTPIPPGTVTAGFNAKPDKVRTGQRDSGDGRLNDWMDGDRVYRVMEEVVGLGSYGRTLTVLTCSSLSIRIEAAEDDDDEEALKESWTPRFRR